jgi:hypothetical protein
MANQARVARAEKEEKVASLEGGIITTTSPSLNPITSLTLLLCPAPKKWVSFLIQMLLQ